MSLPERAEKIRENKQPVGGLSSVDDRDGGVFHINRCRSCGRLLTKLEIVGKMRSAERSGEYHGVCPCGSGSFAPSNPKTWEYFLPRVIRLAFAIWRGQVAPGESR